MTEINEQELDRVLREVVKRTLTDADFRAKAIANGNAAVAEVAGKDLGQSFVFVENTASTRTILLPDAIGESDQLLDEDLEQVAGGLYTAPVESCNGTCGQGSCLHT